MPGSWNATIRFSPPGVMILFDSKPAKDPVRGHFKVLVRYRVGRSSRGNDGGFITYVLISAPAKPG